MRAGALAVASVLTACSGGGGTTGGDLPVVSQSPPDRVVAPTGGDGEPERVEVVEGAVNLRARPFEEAVALDDTTLGVRFFGGVAPCDVVGRVDLAETDEEVIVTLITGRAPDAGDVACIDIAVYQEVVVELEAPLGGRKIIDTEA